MIFTKNTAFIAVLLCLSACGAGVNLKEPQQWQRANASQPVYQQGPKVDQMLDRDIGRCVVQLQEMKDLGLIKTAIEADSTGRVLGPDELREIDAWKKQRGEYKNFIANEADFKTFNDCMEAKGWERIYAPGTSHVQTRGYQAAIE